MNNTNEQITKTENTHSFIDYAFGYTDTNDKQLLNYTLISYLPAIISISFSIFSWFFACPDSSSCGDVRELWVFGPIIFIAVPNILITTSRLLRKNRFKKDPVTWDT